MTYTVRNVTSTAHHWLVGHADSLEAAKALIIDGVFAIEEDADHPNHFDVITPRGEIFTIEPDSSDWDAWRGL